MKIEQKVNEEDGTVSALCPICGKRMRPSETNCKIEPQAGGPPRGYCGTRKVHWHTRQGRAGRR